MTDAVRRLFEPINGKTYASRDLAEGAIKEQYAPLRGEFGPEYSLYHLLRWCYRQGWLKNTESGEYLVLVEGLTAPAGA